MNEESEQFIVYCHCVRSTTGTEMTIPLPPTVTPETAVDYVGNEFDWQFLPMSYKVVPINEVNISEDLW